LNAWSEGDSPHSSGFSIRKATAYAIGSVV
jgi:hypothetical protein